MRRFEVRLEAQDGSGHFRVTYLEAESKAEAKARCQRDEFKRSAFQLNAEQANELCDRYGVKSVDDLPKPGALGEDRSAFREIDTPDRARLHAHYQSEPYKVVSVEVRKGV